MFYHRQIFRQSLMASHQNLVRSLLMNLRLICSCLLLIEMFSKLSVKYRCGVLKQNPISVSVAEFGKKLLSETESPLKERQSHLCNQLQLFKILSVAF